MTSDNSGLDISTTELIARLNQSNSLDGHRSALRKFLEDQLAAYKLNPEMGEDIAYRIAGLMGTDVIRKLPEGDPYKEVIALAGDLELPPAHRDKTSTWVRFAELVRSLPSSD